MQLRSFILAYGVVLAFLLIAVRRPVPRPQSHYSHVVDLTDPTPAKNSEARSGTRMISPAALIPGTWGTAQIPAERLIAPLVVIDLKASSAQISVDDIANWEAQHGHVPQGAIVGVRRVGSAHNPSHQFPMSADAGQFLMDARCTRGFIVETTASVGSDRMLFRQIALHGNYVVEGSARLAALPETGSIVIVAPEKNRTVVKGPVRVLAMVG